MRACEASTESTGSLGELLWISAFASVAKDVALQKLPVRFILDRAGLVGADITSALLNLL